MNKNARVEALRQTIMHAIKGEHELAETQFKAVATAISRRIVMGESNYSLDDDPEFDARRELQRELEDDLGDGTVDPEMGGIEGGDEDVDCDGGDCEVIDAIVAKLEDGEVDDDTLAQILDLLVDAEGGEEGAEEIGGAEGGEDEVGLDFDMGAQDDGADLGADLEDPTKLESAGATSLLDRIKFALRYEYDQFLDVEGDPSEWPEFALLEPSAELQGLLDEIPADLKSKYDAAIKQFIASQVE